MSSESDETMLARLCRNFGADERQALVMARQLLKRADQLSGERGISREEALKGLLEIVVSGRRGEVPPSFSGSTGGSEGDASPEK